MALQREASSFSLLVLVILFSSLGISVTFTTVFLFEYNERRISISVTWSGCKFWCSSLSPHTQESSAHKSQFSSIMSSGTTTPTEITYTLNLFLPDDSGCYDPADISNSFPPPPLTCLSMWSEEKTCCVCIYSPFPAYFDFAGGVSRHLPGFTASPLVWLGLDFTVFEICHARGCWCREVNHQTVWIHLPSGVCLVKINI